MVQLVGGYSIRRCVRDVIGLLERYDGQVTAAEDRFAELFQRLLALPDLLEQGVKRDGNHTGDSLWLYYEPELSILTFSLSQSTTVPVHNHGTWEGIGVYRGAFKYTMYRQADDGSRPYQAELAVVEDRVMQPGEVSLCPPPPHDIHGFTALTDDTCGIAIVGGRYAPVRRYYSPGERYYVERHQQAWRLAGKGEHQR